MVSDARLSDVLSEFARTVITDFPIQAILDHLVPQAVDLLPVTSAGVTLISTGHAPQYVAASNPSALRFEELQTSLQDGPCLLAFVSGTEVVVPDLRAEVRFPRFATAALQAGLCAVFSFPLRHGDRRIGAMDLYKESFGALTPRELRVAQTLADVAAAYLINARARDDARKVSDRLEHIAMHDPLTGLANRSLLLQRLAHAASRARRSHSLAAILYVDLDHFKVVNDTRGHPVGDQLLVAVGRRLAALIRPGDTLARPSGDEFVFLCEDVHSADDVESLALRITAAFEKPFSIAGQQIRVTASVGIAFAGPGDTISDQLIVDADTAMYRAKRNGGARHHVIDLRQALRGDDRTGLEHDLRAALVRHDLELVYQPIVATDDKAMTGVEALLRWNHPERGYLPPQAVVELAEESDLIDDLGEWVITEACQAHRRWSRAYPDVVLDLAVNVSPTQLLTTDFDEQVAAILERTGMRPERLILELTEGSRIADTDAVIAMLARLNERSIRVALDDFGTGESSLSYLRRLPIHIVKIDRSFIADMVLAPRDAAIVAAVTDLAHALGLRVIAEGVETSDQDRYLERMGCDSAQGFYYARPLSASAVASRLRAESRSGADTRMAVAAEDGCSA